MTFSFRSRETDPVLLNDLTQTIREHWEDLDSFDAEQFPMEMKVFNSEGYVIFSNAETELAEITSAEEAVYKGGLGLYIAGELMEK